MDLRESRGNPIADGARHPWERSRAAHFARVLESLPRPRRVLDAGSGDSYLLAELGRGVLAGAELVAWDPHYSDAELAAPPDGVRRCSELPSGDFDLVLALDVLEHAADDLALLRALVARLAPQGQTNAPPRDLCESAGRAGDPARARAHVLLSVPAWPQLFGAHDRALAHHRRYAVRPLRALVAAAGLEVVREGPLFFSLLPLRAAQHLRELLLPPRHPPVADALRWTHGPLASATVESVLRLDAQLGRWLGGKRIRVAGLTYWMLCSPRTTAP